MTPPSKGARSQWSRDITQKRSATRSKKTSTKKAGKK